MMTDIAAKIRAYPGFGHARFVANLMAVRSVPFPVESPFILAAEPAAQTGALREMVRVTKPDGIVAVRDSDYAGFCWWPQIPALDTWLELYRALARTNGGEPDAGRQLLSWAHAAGLEQVAASSSTWCYSTPAERDHWGGMWADRIMNSSIAGQLIESGRATSNDLREISDAWKEWAASKDGWLSIPHGELIYRVISPV